DDELVPGGHGAVDPHSIRVAARFVFVRPLHRDAAADDVVTQPLELLDTACYQRLELRGLVDVPEGDLKGSFHECIECTICAPSAHGVMRADRAVPCEPARGIRSRARAPARTVTDVEPAVRVDRPGARARRC